MGGLVSHWKMRVSGVLGPIRTYLCIAGVLKMTAPRSFSDIRSSQEFRLHRQELVRKYFRVKPTVVERDALDACAVLAIRAVRGVHDTNMSGDELSKIEAAHRRSIATLESLSHARAVRMGRVKREVGLIEARV
jgi:hypothetical protein